LVVVYAVRASFVQRDRAHDEREVAEGLWSIAQLAAVHGIPFVAEQSDVVSEGEQTLEQRDRSVSAPGAVAGIDEPEEQARKTPSPAGSPSLLLSVR
jgi:hypothetical protein